MLSAVRPAVCAICAETTHGKLAADASVVAYTVAGVGLATDARVCTFAAGRQ